MAKKYVYPFGPDGQQPSNYDFSKEAKLILIDTLSKVAWTDANGQVYLDTLRDALLVDLSVESISAVLSTGDDVILDTMSLDDLRKYLTVTATFSDGTSCVVYGYRLSGQIAVGSQTINVTYSQKTTSFTANVIHNYAGDLSTWKLKASSSVAEYANGKCRFKCLTTGDYNGWAVWGIDCKKTLWSAVNGKTLKIKMKVDHLDAGAIFAGVFTGADATSLSEANCLRCELSNVLQESGYYEQTLYCDVSSFSVGTLSPTSSSTFGVGCYSHSMSEYIEVLDVQIYEVESE